MAMNGICATSNPLAAKVAVEMLESGGNAVDAAIAAAVLLGITEPQSTGIGGDCFALISEPGKPVRALNASGRAPAGLDADALRAKGPVMEEFSADAVTLPGAVDGFVTLSEAFGRKGIDACLAPAICHAEDGIPVGARTAFDWDIAQGTLRGDARRFLLANDRPYRFGQIYRAPMQADVLRRIARQGRAGFYEGEVADDMVASLNALGGCHTHADFAAVKADWTDPIVGEYRGVDLIEHPPNGQGATAILIANILSHFDISSLDPTGPARTHLQAEAAKLAYDARDRFVADPDHATRIGHMIADETAAALAALIDPKRAMVSAARASEAIHKDTVLVTVIDKDRMAVSLIYSIFESFGSGLASAKFGINFHNRGAGFTLQPGHPNEAGPRKRPLHTIIPALLGRNGQIFGAFGVMGGQFQPVGHAQILSNLTDYDMDPQEALDAPRSFPENGELRVERGYSAATRAALTDMGHKVVTPLKPHGGGQVILIDPDTGALVAGSDPRKDGCALGY